jgi:type 1 glutamine amidotransferase
VKKQLLILLSLLMLNTVIAEELKPIKVLMITGGGWHDYKTQAPLLKKTIESQINATVDIKWTSTKEHPVKPKTEVLPQIMAMDFAKGYDVVFHNHCHVGFKDDIKINEVIDNHIKNKVGVVLTHGSFHTFRDTNAWDRLCGVHCRTHGRKAPIDVEFINKIHPVSKAINLDRFKTTEGELYRTKLNEGTVAIAKGTTLAGNKSDDTQICVFAHELDGIRVFGTTLGHHNSTMEMPEYKKMIINAILWTSGKIDNGGFSK